MGTSPAITHEAVVRREGRPVFTVINDDVRFDSAESFWTEKLGHYQVRERLRDAVPNVGRLEVENHPDRAWWGTAWLIRDTRVAVTAAHVASKFCDPGTREFLPGWPNRQDKMLARIDFRREFLSANPRPFRVLRVLHIDDDLDTGLAFLELEAMGSYGRLSRGIMLANAPSAKKDWVAAVGYPGADDRIAAEDRPQFGDIFEVKVFAPGQILEVPTGQCADLMHDCTTAGGMSGSPVIDLATGTAVGLHIGGYELLGNVAVPAQVIRARMDALPR